MAIPAAGSPAATATAPAPGPEAPGVPGQRLREGEGPLFVLASARGGVGKSSIAAVCALEAAAWGMDVGLVDLDLAFGTMFSFFGLKGPADLTPLAQDASAEAVARMGVTVAEGVTLYGPCGVPEYSEAVAPQVGTLLRILKERHDLVVVDGPSAWGDVLAQALDQADRVALVTDDRAAAVGSLARAGGLAGRLGVARTRLVHLVNRCDPKRRDDGFVSRASEGCGHGRVFRVLEGGFDVGELLGTGHVAELVALDDDFTRSCRSAVAKLLADLGRLPDTRQAREARDMTVTRRTGLFRFAREAV